MSPSELRSLIAKMSPRPWHIGEYGLAWNRLADRVPQSPADEAAIVALVNRAEALCELWEAAKELVGNSGMVDYYGESEQLSYDVESLRDALAKLEAVK